MTDLFGIEQTNDKPKDPYKGRKNAHPYPPGSGPEGESCGNCEHKRCLPYHNRNYYKCFRMKHAWTNGLGTDIRLKDEACWMWRRERLPFIKVGRALRVSEKDLYEFIEKRRRMPEAEPQDR